MNWKMLAAILVGLAVGVAIPSLRWTQDAQAQRPEKAQQWEYKVVVFVGVISDVQNHAKQLNQFTADGWEYVGLLSSGYHRVRGEPVSAGGMVAFKRPKR